MVAQPMVSEPKLPPRPQLCKEAVAVAYMTYILFCYASGTDGSGHNLSPDSHVVLCSPQHLLGPWSLRRRESDNLVHRGRE
jgi:hypothetical protein